MSKKAAPWFNDVILLVLFVMIYNNDRQKKCIHPSIHPSGNNYDFSVIILMVNYRKITNRIVKNAMSAEINVIPKAYTINDVNNNINTGFGEGAAILKYMKNLYYESLDPCILAL